LKTAILSCFHPFRGGIAQFNASLAEELGREHEVRAYNFTRQYPSFLFPGRTQYVTPQDEAVPVESEALLDTVGPLSWRKTASAIRRWNPDALILRYWMPYFAPSLGYVARHLSPHSKVIGILDNVIPHERHFFDRALTSYFIASLDGAVTLCSEVARDLESFRADIPHRVLHHPVYSHFGGRIPRKEALEALGIEDDSSRNLLFFGLIREYKGLDVLIRSFGLLGEGYRLIIAGEPYGSFDRYRRLIEESPYASRIHVFPEYIRDSQVKLYFSAADLTVLPYRSATQSGIGAISCHFGVPMVVTDVGGLRETVADKGLGMVCPECSPESVAGAVRTYFGEPSLKERFASCIREENIRLSWNRFCKELVGFIESIKK